MINIEGTHITISRGDCEPFTITFTGEDVPEDGALVLFTVKKSASSDNPVLEKELVMQDSQIAVSIMNADTKKLPFGEYEWDVRLKDFYGENEPHTPMEPARFTIAKVVGNV